jgi:hypothetical protein
MLSPEMLDLLRQWWKVRPTRYDTGVPQEQRWLFPGLLNATVALRTQPLSFSAR